MWSWFTREEGSLGTELGMILTLIRAYQNLHCLIVSHHLLVLLEGTLATRGREQAMGLATLGGGLSKQERCRTFLTERLHAAQLVKIWVTRVRTI